MDAVMQLPMQSLSPEDQLELEAAILRHPAGKARELAQCPTCGQNPSGALGDPALSL